MKSINSAEIHIPLEGFIDKDKELGRLQKELIRINQAIEKLETKLGNPNFSEKAPKHIVTAEREKVVAFLSEQQKIKQQQQLIMDI